MLNLNQINLSQYNSDNLSDLSFMIINELELRATYYSARMADRAERIIDDRLLTIMIRDARYKENRENIQ